MMIDYGEHSGATISLIAAMLIEIISKDPYCPALSVVKENDPPYSAFLRVEWPLPEKEEEVETQPMIGIRIASTEGQSPIRFYIEQDLPNDLSMEWKRKIEQTRNHLRMILGKFMTDFLLYLPGEIKNCNGPQLSQVNRLVSRWKKRPEEITQLGETIVVRYGNLFHQIEPDGHTHT